MEQIVSEQERGMANNTKKLGVIALASVVVSSMVGGGIYSLPQNMAAQASVGAVIIAWVVTGIGMFFLANSDRISKRGSTCMAERGSVLSLGSSSLGDTGCARFSAT